MAKSRQEKIISYDEQIAKLQEQRKKEMEKHRQEERKEQDKRRRTRGEIIEKLMPDTVSLTIEEFTVFINKTTANTFGRDKLAEIVKANEAKNKTRETTPQNEKSTPTLSAAPQTPREKPTPLSIQQANGNKNKVKSV